MRVRAAGGLAVTAGRAGSGPSATAAAQVMLPWLLPLSCAAVIAVASRLRYPPPELAFAAPLALPVWSWHLAIGVLLAATLFVVVVSRRRLAEPTVARTLLELAIYPAAMAVVWAWLPPYPEWYRPMHYAAIGCLLAGFACLLWRDRARRGDWGLRRAGFGGALRELAWPTLALLVAGLVLAALTVGFEPRWRRMAVNVFTYPVSAVIQLLLLQVLLLRRLERIGVAGTANVLATAAVFGLVHWPNPTLALGCFLGAALWCRVFLRHGNLPAIAMSMGLLAAILGNVVPREAIDNARTGPIHIQRNIDAAAAEVSTAPPLSEPSAAENLL